MKRALSWTKEGYRHLFDHVGAALFVLDPASGLILDANSAAAGLCGVAVAELPGLRLADFSDGMPPFSPRDFEQWIQLALEKGVQTFEWIACRRNGEHFWAEITLCAANIDDNRRIIATVRDINQRKQTDEALRLEHERAESYLRLAGTMLVALDAEGRVTMINRRGQEILGRRESQILRRNWFDLFIPEDTRETTRATFRRLIAGEIESLEHYENEILTATGQRRLIAWHNTLLHNRSGQITGTLSSGEDITERRSTEERWRASEQRFRLLMEHASDGIGMCERIEQITPDGQRRFKRLLVFCNDRFVEMSGRTREELLRHPDLAQLTRPANTSQEQAAYRKRRDDGLPYEGVSSWMRPDGRENYFEWISVPLQLGGKLYTLEIDREITARRRAEEQFLLQSSALEAAANGIVITDRTGRIVWVNPAYTRLTGYTVTEAIGQFTRVLKSGQHPPAFYRDMWRTILAGKVWRGELVNKRKDGTLYTEDMTITPVYGATGAITHFIAIKQDITEHHRMEEQLRQTNKMEAIGRLAGGVAHDFNNILTAIMGYNDRVLRQLPADSPLRHDLTEIDTEAHRAAQLTLQLLAFIRKQTLQLAVINLNHVVTNMSQMLRRLMGEDIILHTRLTESLGNVRADASQIQQIVLNLAVNARDAMPKGGALTIETDHITLDEEYTREHFDVKPGDYVRLTVTDTGAGMTPEVKAHLFEPFFTTKQQGEGTGLGLATCYGIVKQGSGHITVYSEPGHGTAVNVYLPKLPGQADPPPSTAAPSAPPRGTETLLVVEDEPTVRELAVIVLREQGYNILAAANGIEALRLLEEHPDQHLDMVVTDVVMPQMGGPELAVRLRETRANLKILFTSGYTRDNIQQETGNDHTAFLQKPYTPTTLLRKVREVLDA